MKYDTRGMDVEYVQNQYPNESTEVIVKSMLYVRKYGYPKKSGIIPWFEFILLVVNEFVRSTATK